MSTNMSRRELIAWLAATAGAAGAGATVLLNGSGPPSAASTQPPTSDGALRSSEATSTNRSPEQMGTNTSTRGAGDALLVVIEMPGGNDGLSMAVPYGVGRYYDVRSQTAIAESDVLAVDDQIGLHPNLARLHERGVTLVQGVGDTDPDGSHFEMSARWWAGKSGRDNDGTGWVGRVADLLNDGSTPATGLSIGSGAHAIVRSNNGSALSLPSADAVYALVGADPEDDFRSSYQSALLGFASGADGMSAGGNSSAMSQARGMLHDTIGFAGRLIETDDDDEDDGDDDRRERLGYSYSGLSNSLQFAATVLSGGAGIRVIHVSMDGDFDTHEGHSWKHPELMRDLDDSVAAFHDDLAERGIGDRVMVMTTSEFGRTLQENSSGGLDHGTASVAMLSGPGTGALLGELPSLTQLDDNGDQQATVQMEAYLGGVVEGWLGVPSSEVFGSTVPLDLF